jgi:hypothetical protein
MSDCAPRGLTDGDGAGEAAPGAARSATVGGAPEPAPPAPGAPEPAPTHAPAPAPPRVALRDVFAARPVALVSLSAACAVSLAASACLFGLPVLGLCARTLARTAVGAARGEAPALGHPSAAGGRTLPEAGATLVALLVALAAPALGALLAARGLAALPADLTARGTLWAAAVAGASAVALALVVDRGLAIALGLLAALDRGLRLVPGFTRGAALASALPRGRLAARVGVVAVGPALVTAAVWSLQDAPPGLVAVGAGIAVTAAFALAAAALGALYVEAEGELALRPRASAPTLPKVTRAFFAGAAGLALVSAALLGTLAAVPSPLAPSPALRGVGGTAGWTTLDLGAPAVLPGTDVHLSAAEDGVVIWTSDGGGAGTVRGVPWPMGVAYRPARCGDDACFELVVGGSESAGRTLVDRDGVRRDDGLGDRVARRVSAASLVAVVVALVCFGIALTRASRGIAGIELLASPDDERRARDDGRPRVVEGRLVAPSPATLHLVGRDAVRVEGTVQVVCDRAGLRIGLPPDGEVRVLRGSAAGPLAAESLVDGARVAVIAALPARGAGYREGAAPWPEGARLVPGGVDAARAALAAQVDRAVAPLALLTVAALLFVTVDLAVAVIGG